MKKNLYKIETLTNLHVGSGDANYGVIDNLIQRDVVTGYPTIHGSSLKGALKEFFKGQNFSYLPDVFGNDDKQANYKFLSANLLLLPLRSNKQAFFLATCPAIIKRLEQDNITYGFGLNLGDLLTMNPKTGQPIVFINNTNGLLIEDFENFDKKPKPSDYSIFGNCEDLIIVSDKDFAELVSDQNLPVIARNKLDNGESKNLWYEQVVPHASIFYFVVLHNKDYFDDFDKMFEKKIIQIGANATIGYGFTKISKIK